MTGGVPQLRARGFAKTRAELLLRASLKARLCEMKAVLQHAEMV
jgi:hypothetical protein